MQPRRRVWRPPQPRMAKGGNSTPRDSRPYHPPPRTLGCRWTGRFPWPFGALETTARPARTFQVLPWVAAAALLLVMLPPLLHSDPAVAASQVTFVRSFGEPGRPLVSPGGIDVDAGGAVYLANTGNDTVAKYAPGASAPTWTVGDRGYPLATPSFENPRDVAVLDNLVYVAQPSGVVVLGAADGHFLRSLNFGFKVPIGISIGNDPAGNPLILVSDGSTGKVEVFNSAEQHVRSIPAMTANSGTRDADTDSAGNYYVADYRNNRIAKFSPQGTFITTWGGAGAPSCAQIPKPYGVEVDDADRVYVAASNNNALRSFTADGACLTPLRDRGLRGAAVVAAAPGCRLRRSCAQDLRRRPVGAEGADLQLRRDVGRSAVAIGRWAVSARRDAQRDAIRGRRQRRRLHHRSQQPSHQPLDHCGGAADHVGRRRARALSRHRSTGPPASGWTRATAISGCPTPTRTS